MIFTDITQRVGKGMWADFFLSKLSFEPSRVILVNNLDRSPEDFIVRIREIGKNKLGVFTRPVGGIIVFVETDEDAALLKLFLS